jgi:FMN reductase
MREPFIVGIGGTVRSGSSTEKALRHALGVCEQQGATTKCFAGEELAALPHYVPEPDDRTETARSIVNAIRRSDGLVVASPGYHGTVSGLVKNALDYTEDLRDDDRPYLADIAIGCIATGAGWQGIVSTLATLRSIVHALRGWPTPLGAAINTSTPAFAPDGSPLDEKVKSQLEIIGQDVVRFARMRIATLQSVGP